MPSAIIHRAVAKSVLDKAKLFSEEQETYLYEVGSIAPDSWRNTKKLKDSPLPKIEKRLMSHFSNPGSFLENYDQFLKKYKSQLDNPFMLGYLVHLITDYIAHNSELYKRIFKNKEEEPTQTKKKAKFLNGLVRQRYNLEELRTLTDEEIESFPPMEELDYDGINTTIAYTNNELTTPIEEWIMDDDIDKLLEEIETWSDRILLEIEKYRTGKIVKK